MVNDKSINKFKQIYQQKCLACNDLNSKKNFSCDNSRHDIF